MSRKAKAMEEAYRRAKAEPRDKHFKGKCPSFEVVLKAAKWSIESGRSLNERHFYERYYVNGGKIFDKAMEILNSPLYKALE